MQWPEVNNILSTSDEEEAKYYRRMLSVSAPAKLYLCFMQRPEVNNILSTSDDEEAKYYRRMTNPAFSLVKVSLCCTCMYRSELPVSPAAVVAAAAAALTSS